VIDAWTCSHTDAWMITATLAPAYRVTWNAIDSGTVVVPHDHGALFHGGGQEGVGRIGLGHLSCLGSTVPETQLDAGLQVTIEPLYPDGSVGPAWHGTLGERATVEPFIDEPEAVAPFIDEPEAVVPVAATIDAGPRGDPAGPRWPILVGLVGAVGLGLLARRFTPARRTAAGRVGCG
jgi:hypothetical protein